MLPLWQYEALMSDEHCYPIGQYPSRGQSGQVSLGVLVSEEGGGGVGGGVFWGLLFSFAFCLLLSEQDLVGLN